MKKFLTCLVFLFVLCPCSLAKAETVDTGTIECTSGSLTWTLDDEYNLAVEGEGTVKGNDEGEWDVPWSAYSKQIVSVDMDDAKISFDSGCTSLAKLFSNYTECTSIDLTGMNTENIVNMESMFYACKNLTTLDISDFNTSNVTNMYNMFCSCSNLATLDVSGFNTEKVTNMSGMFCMCETLTSLDVSKFDTGNVESMGMMFGDCTNLTTLNLLNFDTENVTSMSEMFVDCKSLTTLDVSSFDTKNVASMKGMFSGCKELTTLDLSGFNTENVTEMGEMFQTCSGLTTLDILNFDTKKVTGMGRMFKGCTNLTTLDVSKLNTESVTTMSGMFSNCSGLTALNVSNFETANVTNMAEMFSGCSSLEKIELPEFDTSNVEYIDEMFKNCEALTEIDLADFDISNVENMEYMFSGCSNLITADLSGFATSKVTKSEYLFENCKQLTTINMSNFDMSNITSTKGMFMGCENLANLDSVNFSGTALADMSSMFLNCKNLTEIDLSAIQTSSVELSNAFNGCTSLKKLDLSGISHTSTIKIDSYDALEVIVTPQTEFTIPGLEEDYVWIQNDGTIVEDKTTNSIVIQKAKLNYNIEYKLNGGSCENLVDTFNVSEGLQITSTPTRAGYTFAGWYSDEFFTQSVEEIAKGTIGDVTLYAKWTPVEYAIVYQLNGGMNSTANPAVYTIESETITLAAPTKENVVFGGWYTSADFATSVTEIPTGSTGMKTYYAKWICTHTKTIAKDAVEATCKKEGYTGDVYCADCHTLLEEGEVTSLADHAWDEGVVTVKPTETTTGIRTYTCSECGETKEEEIPVVEQACIHTSTEIRNAKEATCKESGYTGDLYCVDCDVRLEAGEPIAVTDHVWTLKSLVDATTEKTGLKTYVCSGCGEEKTEEIPKKEETSGAAGGENGGVTENPGTTGNSTENTTPQQNTDSDAEKQAEIKKVKSVKAKITSAKNVKGKKIQIKIKKQKGYKYQIKISTSKKFKKNVKTYNTSKVSYKTKKLSAGKTYYVKVRVYKVINGEKVYGKWSATKQVKIKK